MVTTQEELPLFKARPGDPLVHEFRTLLHAHGWLKRVEIAELKGWSDRQVRLLAEAMGADVVRSSRRGFKLTADLTDDELGIALEAANFAISQARHQGTYGVRLKRRLHGRVG